MEKLIYQSSPSVMLGSNKFINVPVILQYDATPLIEVVKVEALGYTSQIPIYHSDGTYLAKVTGTRIYANDAGKKAGIELSYPEGMTVCKMDGRVVFEIHHGKGDAFRTTAELYTPDGAFVKGLDKPLPSLLSSNGKTLNVAGMSMSDCTFSGCRIGVWLRSNGSVAIGCN